MKDLRLLVCVLKTILNIALVTRRIFLPTWLCTPTDFRLEEFVLEKTYFGARNWWHFAHDNLQYCRVHGGLIHEEAMMTCFE